MTDSIHVACRHDLTTAGLNRQFLNMPGEMRGGGGGVGGLGGVIQLPKSKGVDKKDFIWNTPISPNVIKVHFRKTLVRKSEMTS